MAESSSVSAARTAPSAADTSSRKWIKKRLAELDPATDWAEIWSLSSLYNQNDFQLHWYYAVTFPFFLITEWGTDAVYRNGTGKLDKQSTKRVEDTVDHMMVWWEHGPYAPETKQSVEMINKLHAHWATRYPGNFTDNDDYLHTLCYEAAGMHRLQRSLGLPGFNEAQKVAAQRFWSAITPLFVVEDGTPVTGFPDDFDGIEAFLDEYINRPWPTLEKGQLATESIINHFATRWFPKPLRPFGRALVTSFYCDQIMRVHQIQTPSAPLRWAARRLIKTMIWLTDNVFPDTKETFPDRRRRLVAEKGARPSTVDTAVNRIVAKQARAGANPTVAATPTPTAGCPYAATRPDMSKA